MTLLTVLFSFAGIYGIIAHTDPTEMDTVAYLRAAADISETGGVLQHIPNCLNGVYRQATQHPVYLLILSLFAERNLSFFIRAKFVTFFFSFILFFSVIWVAGRYFGRKTACAAGLLMVLNATVIRLGTMVACETLLAICFLFFMFFTARGFQNRRSWLAAGLFAGLTFMTKSLGILTIPVFLCSAVWGCRKQIGHLLKSRSFWAFFGIFIMTASPLFIRNIKVYGTPLYSDSSAVLWVDNWHDYSAERADSGEIGLAAYLNQHSLQDVANIFWKGLSVRNVRMITDGLKPFAFWKKIDLNSLQGFHQKTVSNEGLWAFLLMVFFAVGIWVHRKSAFTIPAVFSIMGFYVFVAWFSKIFEGSPPTRLLYCILILILIYTAAGFVFLIDRILSSSLKSGAQRIQKISFFGLLTGIIFCCAVQFDYKNTDLAKTYRINPVFATQLSWVIQNVPAGKKIWAGESFMSYSFYFQQQIQDKAVSLPKVHSAEEYQALAADQQIEFAFIDLATVVHNFSVFRNYFRVHPQLGIIDSGRYPSFFKPIPIPQGLNRFYRIFRILPSQP